MTNYEKMTNRINAMKETALRCAENGSTFYEVWFRKAAELRIKRDRMMVCEAGELAG